MLDPACAELSKSASTSLREKRRLPLSPVLRLAVRSVANSGGVADVVEALEASGEPVGQAMRRHTVVDLGRSNRETGSLPPCHGARKLVRHLRTRLDDPSKVCLLELVQRDRCQCENHGSARFAGQNTDRAVMVAGPEPQHFDVEIAIAARKRQYAAADDKHRLRQRTGLEQPVALVIGSALQFAGDGRALGGW